MKILHLITGLNTGGAEVMLLNLLKKTNREQFDPVVVSLMDQGTLGDSIEALGIRVRTIGMRRGSFSPIKIYHLWRALKQERPDLIQGWMYHANFLGLLMGRLAGISHMVWGLHHTTLDPTKDKRSTLWIAKWCSPLSRWCKAIVACSQATLSVHAELGYRSENMIVIPNGFDLEDFCPNPEARLQLRDELGLPSDSILIGLIARFDPQKDHHNFFRAAHLLLRRYDETVAKKIHYVLCGRDVEDQNDRISTWIRKYELQDHVHLLGLRRDIPSITAALDIATSAASHGEAFPLIIGEAMACGVLCAVTDVGDSTIIVGNTGSIVPPKDSEALCNAWQGLLALPPQERQEMSSKARQRIHEQFSLPNIVRQYESLYEQIYTSAE